MHLSAGRLAVLVLSFATAGVALAQSYPARPVRFLVPTNPGGGLDVIARIVSPALTEGLGRSVVVDNRGGASGAIALETTARAAPDGYTMMIFSVSQIINAEITKPAYDMFRDFAPVSQISAAPYVLTVHPNLPPKNMSEFIAYAKARPGELNYASSGYGTLQQLALELLSLQVGIKLTHVPYKGVGQAFPDLLSGRTQMTMSSVASMANLIRSKGVRPIAVTTEKRTPQLPDVPTMIESGVPGFVVTQWHGVIMPAKTPREIIARMQQEIVKALKHPEVASKLTSDGTESVGSTPQQFAAHMRSERDKWAKVIKQTGISTAQ
jgi:tripartite-type tricarboxylate transporter receptor subunit TctC